MDVVDILLLPIGINIDSKYFGMDDLNNLLPQGNLHLKLTAVHINIHSLPAKFDQLNIMLLRLNQLKINLQIILLCETFLNDNNSALFNIPGYTFIYKNRQSMSRGGVAIYIRDDIKFKLREDIGSDTEGKFESIFIEVITNPKHIIVGEVYRTPNSNEAQSIESYKSIINQINNTKLECLLATDQNFDLLKLDTHKHTSDLFNSFITSGLIPTITRPTRITHTTSTLIDNIYTNITTNPSAIHTGILTYDISDHFPIIFLLVSKHNKNGKVSPLTFQYRPTDPDTMLKLNNHLAGTDCSYLSRLSTNEAWDSFHAKLNEKLKNMLPRKQPKYQLNTS